MALLSQGISVARLTTVGSQVFSTAMNVASSVISASSACTWTATIGSTSKYLFLSLNTAVLYKIKSLTTNSITIYGKFQTTGTTSVVATAPVANELNEVTQINVPSGANSAIDVTHFKSTAREIVPGLVEEGQFTVTGYYDATNSAYSYIDADDKARQKTRLAVSFPDLTKTSSSNPTWCEAWANAMSRPLSGSVDGVVEYSITFEIDGSLRWNQQDSS